MCKDCYIDAGSPSVNNRRTAKAIKLIADLYFLDDCSAGGYGHIVFDDWNIEDGYINSCLIDAENKSMDWISEEGRLLSIKALKYFLKLSDNERYSVLNNFI